MTTVVVLAESPVDREHLPALQPDPLTPAEATELYRAMLVDVCSMVQHAEADLLVNYPDPERVASDADPETALRELLDPELPEPDEARYEVQVGETESGRIGNALTHLLDSEDEETVAVLEPTAPLLRREHVGNAAMKLRSSEVVLGASTGGGVYFAAFAEPIDFEEAFATPAIETVTQRGLDADFDVDFLPLLPRIEGLDGLETAVSLIRARQQAGRIVPQQTAALFEELGLAVEHDGTLSRSSDSS
jgi:2-phospho-L-lactate guanylyltransferase (CobY/MobA/RfbA family)